MLSDVQELSLMLDYESGKFSKAQLLNRYCITAKELDDRVRRGKWRVSDKVRGKEDVLERIVEGAGELARSRGIAGSNLKLLNRYCITAKELDDRVRRDIVTGKQIGRAHV